MRLAIVASPWANVRRGPTGGAERVFFHLGSGLRALGHKVALYAPQSPRLPSSCSPIPYWGRHRTRAWSYALLAYLKTLRADAVVAINCPHLCFLIPERCVVYIQNFGQGLPFLNSRLRSLAYLRWRHVTIAACADSPARWLRERLSFPGRLVVIPNGVDIERFNPFASASRSTSGVAFAGQWNRRKGVDVLLDAARLLEKRGDIRFLLAGSHELWGSGEQDPTIAKAVGRPHPNVDLIGEVPHEEMASFWRMADVAVQASTEDFEGMPLSVLEAMACGLPVVATNVPGNKDLIVQGENGYLVPPADPKGLADAIEKLLDAPEEVRQTLANNARRTAEAHSVEIQVKRFESLLQEFIAS